MRVLVTGASGFIGSAVCDALLARGDEVVGLEPRPGASAAARNPTVTWHAWDPTAERPPAERARGRRRRRQPDRRADRPALDRDGEAAHPRQPRAGDQEPGRRAAAPPSRRPTTLVSQSAVGYYGDRGDAIVDESTRARAELRRRGVRRLGGGRARAPRRSGSGSSSSAPGWCSTPSTACSSSSSCRSSSASAARSRAAASTCPGSTSTTRSRLLLWALDTDARGGRLQRRRRRTRSPTGSSRRRSGASLGRPAVFPLPKLALKAQVRRRAGRDHRRRPARGAAARRSTTASSSATRSSSRRSGTSCGADGSGHAKRVREHGPAADEPVAREGGQRGVADVVDRVGARASSRDPRVSKKALDDRVAVVAPVAGAPDRIERHGHRLVAVGRVAAGRCGRSAAEGPHEPLAGRPAAAWGPGRQR